MLAIVRQGGYASCKLYSYEYWELKRSKMMVRQKYGATSGLTLIELIIVIIIMSVISVVVFTQHKLDARQGKVNQDIAALAAHVRYAQLNAMKFGSVWGIKSSGNYYWMFSGNDPDDGSARQSLPGEVSRTVSLNDKEITLTDFTVFFDEWGIPYSSYTTSSNNVKLSSNIAIVMSDTIDSSATASRAIVAETGFIR